MVAHVSFSGDEVQNLSTVFGRARSLSAPTPVDATGRSQSPVSVGIVEIQHQGWRGGPFAALMALAWASMLALVNNA